MPGYWIEPERQTVVGLSARSAWQDAKDCLGWLEEEENNFRFRMVAVSTIVLLRAVGDVLVKVDAARFPKLKSDIRRQYKSWHKERIFMDFIKAQRNDLVHEYETRLDFNPVIGAEQGGESMEIRVGSVIYCPVTRGRYKGEDVRDVITEALEWLDVQLKRIETSLNTPTPTSSATAPDEVI
jgi:hypothetical protein